MKILFSATAVACLLGLAPLSHATTLATAPTFAAPSQRSAHCSIGNTGTKPISVTVKVFDEAGNAFAAPSTCNEPIPPQSICTVFANTIPSLSAVACSATTAGSADKLRGSLTILDDRELPLRSVRLR